MRKILLTAAILCSLVTFGKGKNNQPATVIITAGQSNTDGRVLNNALPDYFNKINISIANGVTEAPDSRSLESSKFSGPVWYIRHARDAGHMMP